MWNFITLMEKTPALNDELWLFNFFIYAEKCFWRQQANKMKTATRHIWATDLSKPQTMTVAKNWIFDIFRKTVYFLNKMMSAFLSWLIFARRTGFYRMFFVEPSEQLQQTVCCSLIQEDRKWEYESVCDLVSLSTDSVCGAGTRVCASPRLVRHTGRKLQVQGKEKDGADGRPAHRFSCSQELISPSSTPRVANSTHTCTQTDTADEGVRDMTVQLCARGTRPGGHYLCSVASSCSS